MGLEPRDSIFIPSNPSFSEKSRLESNYQEDKKKLRAELNEREQTILNLKQEVKQVREKYRTEIDDAKSKLIIERHNR